MPEDQHAEDFVPGPAPDRRRPTARRRSPRWRAAGNRGPARHARRERRAYRAGTPRPARPEEPVALPAVI